MATQSSVALSSQNATIPQIPVVDKDTSAQSPGNSLLTAALTETRNYTQGHVPAFSSTGSATLDAFNFLHHWSYSEVKSHLGKTTR